MNRSTKLAVGGRSGAALDVGRRPLSLRQFRLRARLSRKPRRLLLMHKSGTLARRYRLNSLLFTDIQGKEECSSRWTVSSANSSLLVMMAPNATEAACSICRAAARPFRADAQPVFGDYPATTDGGFRKTGSSPYLQLVIDRLEVGHPDYSKARSPLAMSSSYPAALRAVSVRAQKRKRIGKMNKEVTLPMSPSRATRQAASP